MRQFVPLLILAAALYDMGWWDEKRLAGTGVEVTDPAPS